MASVKVTLWDAVVPKRGLMRQTPRELGLGTNYALLSGCSSIPRGEVRPDFRQRRRSDLGIGNNVLKVVGTRAASMNSRR
jgi:hypothetical protein